MVASIPNAIAAYANAGKIAGAADTGASTSTGTGFADLVKEAASDALKTMKEGEAESLKAVTGKADLTAVTAAVNNAEMVLQTVTAVRDRVISAYQDISKMPI